MDFDNDGGCDEDDGGGKDGGLSPALRPRFPAGLRACEHVVYRAGWSGRRESWRGRAGQKRLRRWCPGVTGGRWVACGETAGCWMSVCRAPDRSQRYGAKTDGCCCGDTRTTDSLQTRERVTGAPNPTAQTENSDSFLASDVHKHAELWVLSYAGNHSHLSQNSQNSHCHTTDHLHRNLPHSHRCYSRHHNLYAVCAKC